MNGEYPILTTPCTNALHKVWHVKHRVLSFCINTLRETKVDLLIGVNSILLGIVDTRLDIDISIDHVSESI